MTIDLIAAYDNARDSIRFSFESDSNEIDASDVLPSKQDGPRTSTAQGITIDLIPEFENANDSIHINLEFDSNESNDIDLQEKKQFEPRIRVKSVPMPFRAPAGVITWLHVQVTVICL
jgi:hypothetical protein